MSRVCFGTYGLAIFKAVTTPSNVRVVGLLLNLILDNETIMNQMNEPFVVTDTIASNLLSCKKPVLKKIQQVATNPKIIDLAEDYFTDVVVPELNPNLIAALLIELSDLISSDATVVHTIKDELPSLANEEHVAEFLSKTFLYSLGKPNKISISQLADANMEITEEITPYLNDIKALQVLLDKFPRPQGIMPPEEPTQEEQIYVEELLAAYAEALKMDELPKDLLQNFPKYAKDFMQRRNEYYSAEAVKNETREVFPDNPSEFETLKDETYSGIYDVHSKTFNHGFERLLNVMEKVTGLPINKSLLGRMPHWMGSNERKGVCHMLVNDGTIKWVDEDD